MIKNEFLPPYIRVKRPSTYLKNFFILGLYGTCYTTQYKYNYL